MKNRVKWIDIAKGMAIILVVIGHLNKKWFPDLDILIREVYTFHMMLFFILSGFTLKYKSDKSIKQVIKKKSKTLLIPYIAFSSIALIKPFVRAFINLINGNALDFSGIIISIYKTYIIGEGLWFLICLYLAEIIICCFIKISKDRKILFICFMFICSISQFMYNKFINITLPLQLNKLLISITFIGIGMLISQSKLIKKINKLYYPVLFLFINLITNLIICKIYNTTISIGEMPNYILYFISSISGSLIIISLSILVNENKIIEYIGKNSLIIYIFNDIILKVLKIIVLFILRIDLPNSILLVQLLIAVVMVIMTIVLAVPIIKIINKYFYKFLGSKERIS